MSSRRTRSTSRSDASVTTTSPTRTAAGRRGLDAAEQVQQRRLARTGRPDQHDELARDAASSEASTSACTSPAGVRWTTERPEASSTGSVMRGPPSLGARPTDSRRVTAGGSAAGAAPSAGPATPGRRTSASRRPGAGGVGARRHPATRRRGRGSAASRTRSRSEAAARTRRAAAADRPGRARRTPRRRACSRPCSSAWVERSTSVEVRPSRICTVRARARRPRVVRDDERRGAELAVDRRIVASTSRRWRARRARRSARRRGARADRSRGRPRSRRAAAGRPTARPAGGRRHRATPEQVEQLRGARPDRGGRRRSPARAARSRSR